jgi:hypothetical protein
MCPKFRPFSTTPVNFQQFILVVDHFFQCANLPIDLKDGEHGGMNVQAGKVPLDIPVERFSVHHSLRWGRRVPARPKALMCGLDTAGFPSVDKTLQCGTPVGEVALPMRSPDDENMTVVRIIQNAGCHRVDG